MVKKKDNFNDIIFILFFLKKKKKLLLMVKCDNYIYIEKKIVNYLFQGIIKKYINGINGKIL